MMTQQAPIGHNNPPEPTPFEQSKQEIEDLYLEATNWLDGDPITTQEMADELTKLMNLIRAATKKADARRKEEVKPYDEAKAEIQERYAPLIADNKSCKGKAILALDVCKKALTPFLERQEAEKRAAAEKAREEAEAARREAEEAMRASRADDLAAREAAEAKLQAAKKADAAASKTEKDRPRSSGGVGRAATLRATPVPVLVDAVAAARHYWQVARPDMEEFLLSMAKQDVRNGRTDIPGFEIKNDRSVV